MKIKYRILNVVCFEIYSFIELFECVVSILTFGFIQPSFSFNFLSWHSKKMLKWR